VPTGLVKLLQANLLCQRLKADYQKTPPRALKWVANLIDKLHNPELETIGYLFLAALTSIIISCRLWRRSVICDKYVLTTVVAQSCLGGKLARSLRKVRYRLARKPDYTFCLIVSDRDKLMQRLTSKSRLDRNDRQMLPYWSTVQSDYATFPEVIIVDTTHQSPEEVSNTVLDYLKH